MKKLRTVLIAMLLVVGLLASAVPTVSAQGGIINVFKYEDLD